MIVRRLSGLDGARQAVGTAVIIDVFRAFTTAAFCIAAGAREVMFVGDHAEALALKANDQELFLTGEIGGRPIQGFDIGNSPSKIVDLDLRGRRVVQRTSAGTQGVVAALSATEVVLGSLVIAGATARYVRGRDPISLVAMGTAGGDDHGEDEICAAYLEQLVLGAAPPRPEIALAPAAEWPDWFPRRDAELALEVDRFDFALPVARESGLFIARPVKV